MKTRIHALAYPVRNVMPIINNILSRVLFSAAKSGVAKVAAPQTVHGSSTPEHFYVFHGTILLLSFITFHVSELHTSLLVTYYNQQSSN